MKNLPKVFFFAMMAALWVIGGMATIVQGKAKMDNPRAPNLVHQFSKLATHGDPLGARLGVGDDACACVHYQGIARGQDNSGVPYMFLTRSGNDGALFIPVWCVEGFCFGGDYYGQRCGYGGCASFTYDKKPGELVVVQLASRNRDGERLRSNLLEKWDGEFDPRLINLPGYAKSWASYTEPPDEADKVVTSIHFDGQFGESYPGANDGPKYMHPGGIQLVGDVLIVALERHCDGDFSINGNCDTLWPPPAPPVPPPAADGKGAIALIDVSTPANPKMLHWQEIGRSVNQSGMYLVAATLVKAGEHPYFQRHDRYLFFWTGNDADYYISWSDTDDLHTTTDIGISAQWNKDYVNNWMKFQALNFVRDEDGTLFLIGTDHSRSDAETVLGGGNDRVRLFRVDLIKLTNEPIRDADGNVIKDKDNKPIPVIRDAITFVADRHLKLNKPKMGDFDAAGGAYVSPSGQLMLYSADHDNGGLDGGLQMGEFRNIDIRQGGSLPDDQCGGWVELYEDPYGWIGTGGRSLIFDYVDRDKEDWKNLDWYDDQFGDMTRAVRWNLAEGQVAHLYEHADFQGDSIQLRWDENWKAQPDLSYHPLNKKISSVKIEDPPGLLDHEICDGIDNDCNGFSDDGYGHNNDRDGWGSDCDNCPDHANADQADSDVDGVGDVCDNCPDTYNPPGSWEDIHGFTHEGEQPDSDLDGFGDSCDTCPNVPNPGQSDGDNDGVFDGCDNCPDHMNPFQEDADGDGFGDVCDECPHDPNIGRKR